MLLKSFWSGVGLTSALWLWRRQLRPVAVMGAKVGLLFIDGIQDNVRAAKCVLKDLKQDSQKTAYKD
ncbi:hypothetical protein [Desulfosporosinus youngiae]|uniref:Uncharacterized protein n=1 Tax=Desulfosporosinus youngiae DSM 17734 TaxID=768710 RepID=H5XV66_9FIRM|nr:hypothetical protein [Desulfosporosinus youngiae]EHQ89664.1 hypothetical protein DesyoDRAFT_2598 [Desulfosporosinus youngiae DSM 17734]